MAISPFLEAQQNTTIQFDRLELSIDTVRIDSGFYFEIPAYDMSGINPKLLKFSRQSSNVDLCLFEVDMWDGVIYDEYLFQFVSNKSDKSVLFWLLDYEMMSYVMIAAFELENLINKVEFLIGQVCERCDDYVFPGENIRVTERDGIIEIEFYDRVYLDNG